MSLLDIKKSHQKDVSRLLENKEIVVVGPSDTLGTMLRVYSHGGLIGRLAVGNSGESHLLDKTYYMTFKGEKKYDYLKEEELDTLLEIISNESKTTTEKLLSKEYLNIAIEAAKNKGQKKTDGEEVSAKERDVQTQIVRKYMSGNKWIVVDMEFIPSSKWNIGGGKPDLIIYDFARNELGIIELKYNNENVENLGKHYTDFLDVYNNPLPFNREMARRILEYMVPCGLIEERAGDKICQALGTSKEPKNTKIWFGFLFVVNPLEVQNGLIGARNVVNKFLRDKDGKQIKPICDCRFLYTESVDSLTIKGLCYADMGSYKDFMSNSI